MRRLLLCPFLLALVSAHPSFGGTATDKLDPITPQQLAMTSEPNAPGAKAVILDYREINDENLNMNSITVRVKILTEAGKSLADQELPNLARSFSIEDVNGRTVHPDGTVIPFTGKPYVKMLDSISGRKFSATVFTLPDVQVGSIIEYHYKMRFQDTLVQGARWYLQQRLYVEHAKYEYVMFDKPNHFITGPDGSTLNRVTYASRLPAGDKVIEASHGHYTLESSNIPAIAEEPFALPESSRSFKVEFYYLGAFSRDDFWKSVGKNFSKQADNFAETSKDVRSAASAIYGAGDNDEQKSRKLYAAVMTYDNTRYSHKRSANEDKAQGLNPVKTAADVIARQRGSEDQIALAYLALARSAGLRAYALKISDRRHHIYDVSILDQSQFDDFAVLVMVNGKEVILDPGARFCPYGQLAWFHTMSSALRQSDGGVQTVQMPSGDYRDNLEARVGNMALSEDGIATGTLRLQFSGQRGMEMRQAISEDDKAAANHYFEEYAHRLMSSDATVTVMATTNGEDCDKPLIVDFRVQGPIGAGTSKHFLVPIGIFEANHTQTFTAATRQDPVIMDYPFVYQDKVQLTLPDSLAVESVAKDGDTTFGQFGIYRLKTTQAGKVVTINRIFALGSQFYKPEQYSQLRDFYAMARAKDDEQVVFKVERHAAGE